MAGEELGLVHPFSFQVRRDGPVVLLLAGRSWEVSHVDWDRRVAYVKATTAQGRSRWLGSGISLRFDLCRAIRRVLHEGTLDVQFSRRARTALDEILKTFSWVDGTGTAIVHHATGATRWWTFAGLRANLTLGELLGTLRVPTSREDNLSIQLREGASVEVVKRRLEEVTADAPAGALPVTDDAVDSLKFSACLPRDLAVRTLRQRGSDPEAVRTCLHEPIRHVSAH